MNKTSRMFLVGVVATMIIAAACGNDDGDDASTTTRAAATTTTAGTEVAAQVLDLAASEEGLTGLPAEIGAGVVTVRLTVSEALDSPDFELDFTRVAEGTSEEDFEAGLVPLLEGGPFPDFLLDNAGVGVGEFSIELEEGLHIVWFELGSGEDEGEDAAPPEIVTTTLTVTGEAGGELPETGGTITATDYAFDVDVVAGDSFTFVNQSRAQFHHAILLDFGTLDPATVEENLPAFIASEEGEEPPPAFADLDFESLFAGGGSGVFGPGSAGTAMANLESGSTYAVVCFIQDRTGGPPHVVGHDMFEVFQVD